MAVGFQKNTKELQVEQHAKGTSVEAVSVALSTFRALQLEFITVHRS